MTPTGAGPGWYLDLVEGWSRALRRRGRAVKTLRTYQWVARDLGRWLVSQAEIPAGPEQLTAELLHRWQDDLRGRTKPGSQLTCASAVRSLLRWAAREHLGVPAGLWEYVDSPKVPEALPRALERDVLDRILRHYSRPSRSFERLRDRALFLFLLTGGSRISEALSLNRDQVARMLVRVKGGREHVIVPSAKARTWIREYLMARGRDRQAALWIRIGPRGRHRLREQEANEIWAELCDQLGLEHFTCHALRHTCATEFGEAGASDADLAQHLGWKNASMAIRYRRLREDRRRELVDQLDRLVPDAPPEPERRRRRRPRVEVLRGRGRGRTLPA